MCTVGRRCGVRVSKVGARGDCTGVSTAALHMHIPMREKDICIKGYSAKFLPYKKLLGTRSSHFLMNSSSNKKMVSKVS